MEDKPLNKVQLVYEFHVAQWYSFRKRFDSSSDELVDFLRILLNKRELCSVELSIMARGRLLVTRDVDHWESSFLSA